MHLDTSESSLKMKVPGTWTVHSGNSVIFIVILSHMLCTLYPYAHVRYAYVTHTLAYVRHTLFIRSHTLWIRYSYAGIRYAYVTHTLTYVMHMLLIRYHDGLSSIARVKNSKVVRIGSFFPKFSYATHTFYHTL